MTLFGREQLEEGLRQLVAKLRAFDETTSVRIVGGAALALRHFDRDSTRDIDAAIESESSQVSVAVAEIAAENGWDSDWLNHEAAKYIPAWGRPVEWESIYDDGKVVIQVAPSNALLAMKLRANRPGRDNADIARLMAICNIADVEGLDDLYESFYPGDSLDDRAVKIVENILSVGIPDAPRPPKSANIGDREP